MKIRHARNANHGFARHRVAVYFFEDDATNVFERFSVLTVTRGFAVRTARIATTIFNNGSLEFNPDAFRGSCSSRIRFQPAPNVSTYCDSREKATVAYLKQKRNESVRNRGCFFLIFKHADTINDYGNFCDRLAHFLRILKDRFPTSRIREISRCLSSKENL